MQLDERVPFSAFPVLPYPRCQTLEVEELRQTLETVRERNAALSAKVAVPKFRRAVAMAQALQLRSAELATVNDDVKAMQLLERQMTKRIQEIKTAQVGPFAKPAHLIAILPVAPFVARRLARPVSS